MSDEPEQLSGARRARRNAQLVAAMVRLHPRLFGAALVGAASVLGCGDDDSGGSAGSGGTAGSGGGNGNDPCAQLEARCEADCAPDSGDKAICLQVVNEGDPDECQILLEADVDGCPVEV